MSHKVHHFAPVHWIRTWLLDDFRHFELLAKKRESTSDSYDKTVKFIRPACSMQQTWHLIVAVQILCSRVAKRLRRHGRSVTPSDLQVWKLDFWDAFCAFSSRLQLDVINTGFFHLASNIELLTPFQVKMMFLHSGIWICWNFKVASTFLHSELQLRSPCLFVA